MTGKICLVQELFNKADVKPAHSLPTYASETNLDIKLSRH